MDRVSGWIEKSGEVLVVLRYLRAAGAKDFALCRTSEDFESLVRFVAIGTDIEVFRDPQLPLRGIVDGAFIATATSESTKWQEHLLLSVETRPDSVISRFSDLDCPGPELLKSLEQLRGQRVALGECPDFNLEDHEGLISASKGGIDGPR